MFCGFLLSCTPNVQLDQSWKCGKNNILCYEASFRSCALFPTTNGSWKIQSQQSPGLNNDKLEVKLRSAIWTECGWHCSGQTSMFSWVLWYRLREWKGENQLCYCRGCTVLICFNSKLDSIDIQCLAIYHSLMHNSGQVCTLDDLSGFNLELDQHPAEPEAGGTIIVGLVSSSLTTGSHRLLPHTWSKEVGKQYFRVTDK